MKNKEVYSRNEVIEMLQDMQRESIETQGFVIGHLSKLWVVRDLIGQKIKEMGGDEVPYTVE